MRVIQMNPFPEKIPPVINSPVPFVPVAPPPRRGVNIRNFKTDDWILLGIIATLVLEGSEDYILLCALGYLFLVGLPEM